MNSVTVLKRLILMGWLTDIFTLPATNAQISAESGFRKLNSLAGGFLGSWKNTKR